ncbi:MAG: hypothetical protein RSB10_05960, partial [Clostridia bacterium]
DIVDENEKKILIIRQIFDGVKIKEFNFSIEDIDVDLLAINDISMTATNTIRFEVITEMEFGYQSKVIDPVVEFEFESYKWEVIGEE